MFSYEDRLRAVRLYIKLGKRLGVTMAAGISDKECAQDLVPRVRAAR